MAYEIKIVRSVAKAFRRLHPRDAIRIRATIEALAVNPRPPGCIQLAGGEGEYRVRVGNFRIIYDIHDEELVILVLRLGHRREVYR